MEVYFCGRRSGTEHFFFFEKRAWKVSPNLALDLTPDLAQTWLVFVPSCQQFRCVSHFHHARDLTWIGPRFDPGRGLKRNSKRSLQNVTNGLCSLMFKGRSQEHRTVFDPPMSIQREEWCKSASEESEMVPQAPRNHVS